MLAQRITGLHSGRCDRHTEPAFVAKYAFQLPRNQHFYHKHHSDGTGRAEAGILLRLTELVKRTGARVGFLD